MTQFAGDHAARDDADHLAAGGESGVGQDAHEADVTAAIDDGEAALGEDGAAAPGGGGIFGQGAGAGTAVDADALQNLFLR